MSLPRIALSCLALLLLLILGTGIYYYRNLPALVEQQAKRSLQEFGVNTLNYENLAISREHLHTDTLELSGEYEGFQYTATLSSLDLSFDWRMLLNRQVHSLSLGTLKLSVREKSTAATSPPPPTLAVSSLLPKNYIADLPLRDIEIRDWQLEYHGLDRAPVVASGKLQLKDQLHVLAETSYLGIDFSVALRTEGADQLPEVDITMAETGSQIARLNTILEQDKSDNWLWTVSADMTYSPLLASLRQLAHTGQLPAAMPTLDALEISGRTTLLASVTHSDDLLVKTADPSAILSQFIIEIDARNDIENLAYTDMISSLSANFDTRLALSGGEFQIGVGPTELDARVHVQALPLPAETVGWLQWGETIPLQWITPEIVNVFPTDRGGWSFALKDNLLLIGDNKSELRLESINLNTSITSGEEIAINTALSARLNTRLRKKQLPPFNMGLSHKGPLTEGVFSFSLDDVAQSMSLSLEGGGDITKGIGRYQLTAGSQDLRYASESVFPLLKNFGLVGKNLKLEIFGGQMTLESELRSSSFDLNLVKQTSQLEIRNLSGIYDEYRFDGVSAVAHWTGTESLQTLSPVELSIASLDLGFEVTDTLLSLSLPKATPLQQPVVNIESFSSNMFGGQVLLPEPAFWDFGAETNHFSIQAKNWRLADMVAMQTGQDIRAQGLLEGELPVTVTGGRIIVADGFLRALAPGGSIRYVANEASKALAASSPELALAMDLLSDFQYEVLSSRVDLDRQGNLLLGLALAGKNPALYDGRQVNFNINLEQNLDPLLQSLRLSDKLVEQLESRIQ